MYWVQYLFSLFFYLLVDLKHTLRHTITFNSKRKAMFEINIKAYQQTKQYEQQ